VVRRAFPPLLCVDTFRYFIVREAPFGKDLTFSEDALVLRTTPS
jgi:methionyl-tRNA synthetase